MIHHVCNLDKSLFSLVEANIQSDEVVFTEERMAHVRIQHGDDFLLFKERLAEAIMNPDYILASAFPHTAMILKEFHSDGKRLNLILRLAVVSDNSKRKNSIITYHVLSGKKWEKYLRNKKILYRKESII